MNEDNREVPDTNRINRRSFVKTSGAALAGGVALGPTPMAENESVSKVYGPDALFPVQPSQEGRIRSYRTLGRTGFRVSDISLGSSFLREGNVLRYAFDKGVNYVDTAEAYQNGAVERAIRDALQHINRDEIFITTHSDIRADSSREFVLGKARGSLERMGTDYIDAFLMSSVESVEWLNAPGYHAAIEQLKAEGKVRFAGVTYHGPEATKQTGMADVLCAAAEDGRFDVLLLVYNFLSADEGDRILRAAKANNVGTTAMKIAMGRLRAERFDPDNLPIVFQNYLDAMIRSGSSRERALDQLRHYFNEQNRFVESSRAFAERYGIDSDEALRLASIQWAIQNPDMHTACISVWSFDAVDQAVALSGTRLTTPAEGFLQDARATLDSQYCRHGCVDCLESCPAEVPVSNIMRYAYYFEMQGQERHAMSSYAALGGPGASPCIECAGHCAGACPHGVHIQPTMLRAHDLLTLA